MLPPIDEAVLQQNPDFAALYKTLTTAVLNDDGSTKADHSRKEREAVQKELQSHRLKSAKQHLLAQALSSATPPDAAAAKPPTAGPRRGPRAQLPTPAAATTPTAADISPELLELLILLPQLLEEANTLPAESTALLLSTPPFSSLPDLLPQLAPLVSSTLHSAALSLARIANPTTNPSYLHRSIPALPSHAASLSGPALASAKSDLTTSRLKTAAAAADLLSAQTSVLTTLLRSVEAKHGTVARSLELRAEDVALAAQRAEVRADTALWTARRDVYSPAARSALRGYAAHLRDSTLRMEESLRTLEAQLGEYGVSAGGEGEKGRRRDGSGGGGGGEGKERTMREMARVYREMGKQLEEVRGDLERLGKA
ncbi:uncharacterized protein E0L32_010513 [Thyridium curvatum]|uniref:Uncharacterized protein n=1 Tax=Thyridium curvatum TaxID=1093900 RepID=A0A507AMM7_9PEZI|nr:uncharacterized protein E0L32_010513 [Thyridium curvatum]TPX07826.1 hypothetical protein E0L32_010513 [Thyridium curvatum]